MAGMCCGINVGETEPVSPVEPGVRSGHRKRIEIRKIISDISGDIADNQRLIKRPKTEDSVEDSNPPAEEIVQDSPKYGVTSVCGRRRDMEDSVSVIPDFLGGNSKNNSKKRKFNQGAHFYGVYDGHGCSHVAKKCKERMHAIVKDEIDSRESVEENWTETMASSFIRMDREVGERVNMAGNGASTSTSCRCELQTPQCDAVGSTAVVSLVTPSQIVVSNCGDSRAILCRGGVAIPLSSDHKPDRPDELNRIEQAGGRVIYWDGPRVLGVLAMSRAIGDNYLKPYVIPDPEVTVTERSSSDECLILASDGLWDVVSNETAATVARMCLMNADKSPANDETDISDKGCTDASILLTKLALARRSTDNVSVVVVDLRKRLNQ
ncbi:protein phosphatase 2C 37-like [Silene latifolia]|uniref:protein phosphatase 2C 37-like n=1 Tax=Silene latifolia TaxID=37657 RepID=UPI003D775BD6